MPPYSVGTGIASSPRRAISARTSAGIRPSLVDPPLVRPEDLVAEASDRLLERPLLVAEGEIHRRSPATRAAGLKGAPGARGTPGQLLYPGTGWDGSGPAPMVVRVAINGYGTIGKRVADAVAKQPDMKLVGVAKTRPSFEARAAVERGYPAVRRGRRQDRATSASRASRSRGRSPRCSSSPTSSSTPPRRRSAARTRSCTRRRRSAPSSREARRPISPRCRSTRSPTTPPRRAGAGSASSRATPPGSPARPRCSGADFGIARVGGDDRPPGGRSRRVEEGPAQRDPADVQAPVPPRPGRPDDLSRT